MLLHVSRRDVLSDGHAGTGNIWMTPLEKLLRGSWVVLKQTRTSRPNLLAGSGKEKCNSASQLQLNTQRFPRSPLNAKGSWVSGLRGLEV